MQSKLSFCGAGCGRGRGEQDTGKEPAAPENASPWWGQSKHPGLRALDEGTVPLPNAVLTAGLVAFWLQNQSLS